MKCRLIKVMALTWICSLFFVGCSAKSLESNLKKGRDVIIRNQSFSSELDLTQYIDLIQVTPDRKNGRVNGNVVFIDCMFNGFKAYSHKDDKMVTLTFAENLIFKNCAFNGVTELSHIEVKGDFSMLECEVAGPLILNNAWFRGKSTSFTSARFFDKVKAVKCIFDYNTSFFNAEFEQSASFQRSLFKGKTMLNGVTFHKYAGFDQVIFQNGVSFDKSVFKNVALFDQTSFLIEASFNECDLGKSPSFENALFLANTSFKACTIPEKWIIQQKTVSAEIPVLRP